MLKKFATTLVAMLCLGGALTALAPAAVAAPPPCTPSPTGVYPPSLCQAAATSDSSATLGQRITVTSGDGQFDIGAIVRVTVESCSGVTAFDLGNRRASALGGVSVTFTVPTDFANGCYRARFVGPLDGQGSSALTAFQVAAGGGSAVGGDAGSGGGLPYTGGDVLPLVGSGAALLFVGIGALLVARRRQQVTATA